MTYRCLGWTWLLLIVWQILSEHTTDQYILGFNGHQVGLKDFTPFGKEAIGLAQACPVQRIAHTTSIGEAGHEHTPLEIRFKGLLRFWTETIHLLSKHELGNSK